MQIKTLEPQDILSCPSCGLHLLRCLENPISYEWNTSYRFEEINFKDSSEPKTVCLKCNTEWALFNEGGSIRCVHVEGKGWCI